MELLRARKFVIFDRGCSSNSNFNGTWSCDATTRSTPRHEIHFSSKTPSLDTHCLLLLPRLHGRFVFLELVTPVGVNFLIVIAFVRWRTSGVRKEIQLFLLQFSNAFESELGEGKREAELCVEEKLLLVLKASPTTPGNVVGGWSEFHISSLAYDATAPLPMSINCDAVTTQ